MQAQSDEINQENAKDDNFEIDRPKLQEKEKSVLDRSQLLIEPVPLRE